MISTLRELQLRGTVRTVRSSHVESRPTVGWRWFALLAISGSVLHTWAAASSDEPNLATFLDLHGGEFAPAQAAFALLGAIHLGLVFYGVAQLTKHHEETRAFDQLAPLAGLAALIASFELVAAGQDLAWLVAPLGLGLAASTLALYLRAHRAIAAGAAPRWTGAPFALWFAWSAALLPAKLAAAGWSTDGAGIAIIGALAVFALVSGFRYRDAALPGATAWLLFELTSAQPAEVRGVALLGAAACAVLAVVEMSFRAFATPAPAAPAPIRARTTTGRRQAVYHFADL